MSGLYQIFFIIFLVLTFFVGFVMNVSRFDMKTASVTSTNQQLNHYVQLLDEKVSRMLEVKGKVVFDTTGFYKSLNKFSKRDRLTLAPTESFYFFEKNMSVQFTLDNIDDDGAVISYEARRTDRSSGEEIVSADRGSFKMAWRF